MGFLQNLLNVISLLSFLNELSSPVDSVSPEVSLWGKMANFTHYCSYWKLRPGVSVPALGELTVCLHLQTKASTPSMWTAFMYRSPEGQWAELGLGGRRGYLSIWLFGREWRTTAPVYLHADLWHYLCVSWSHTTYAPSLYVNGRMLHLFVVDVDVEDSPVHPPHRRLAPNGTLTLGTSHFLAADGTLHVFGCLKGWLSLFRMWGRTCSRQEVTSVMCTGGDVLKWEENHWEIHSPVADSTLLCDWSLYEVRVRFLILRHDGKNTNLYTARDLARRWLREVLPLNMTLHSVSVFELASPHAVVSPGETVNDELKILLSTPTVDRFDSVVQVNVFPSMDVSVVQADMTKYLQASYTEPHTLLYLMADPDSIYTISVESFDSTSTSPAVTEKQPSTAVVTFSTTSSPPAHTSTKPVLTNTSTNAGTASPLPLQTQNSTCITTTTKPLPTGTTSTTSTSAPVTMTTTTFTTAPENISGLYFEVKLNVSITGECNPEESLKVWLETSLPRGEMVVLNFQLLPKKNGLNLLSNRSISQVTSLRGSSRESCVFQVHVMKLTDAEEIEKKIRHLLEQPYNSSSVAVATQDIQISRILVLHCPAHRHQTRKGLFAWPKTWATHIVNQPCPGNKLQLAWRHCKLGIPTRWMVPDLVRCPLVVERIPDLNDIEVTAENAADVVEMIESLLSDHSTLSYEELLTVLNKLKAIVSLGVITPDLGRAVINIISVIMESDSHLGPFTNTILNITEDVGDRMWGYDGSSTLLAPAIAISVVDVHPGQFDTLTFAVSSAQQGLNPEIYINKPPFSGAVAFISLPPALKHSFPQNGQGSPRVQFQFYGIPMLFKSSQQEGVLNTFVVSASVTNVSCPITQLGEDVQITLHHLLPNALNKDVQCVYWNFNRNGGHGGWDGSGCRKHNTSTHYTTCLCDHLTHFGVLLDMSRSQVDPVNDQILTIITYLGCGVSSLFLGVTVLTYTAFEKLRRDYPSKILINLSLALLGLNLVFLVNSWLASWGLRGLCVAAAAAMHYFLLASFTWMGLEAVNMYFALVKVFNVYVPSYILKFCLLGWGVPLLVCVLVLIVNREAYGSQLYSEAPLQNADHFCWLQDDVTFYVSVVAYAVVIFLFNIAVFVVVLVQIRHMRVNRPAGIPGGLMQDLKGMASLTLLLGLTWTLGFFTWGPARVALLYLFSALNSLQGLFIFLFHCLMKENVRKQWRIHLCFGRFRLDEYSEWSHTASVGAVSRHRANAPAPLVHSVRSTKTSTTDSTSASSDSSQRVGSIRRPSLGLFVNVMSLTRAQRGSSPLPYQSFPEGGEPYSPAWDHSPLERGEPYSPAWDHPPHP